MRNSLQSASQISGKLEAIEGIKKDTGIDQDEF